MANSVRGSSLFSGGPAAWLGSRDAWVGAQARWRVWRACASGHGSARAERTGQSARGRAHGAGEARRGAHQHLLAAVHLSGEALLVAVGVEDGEGHLVLPRAQLLVRDKGVAERALLPRAERVAVHAAGEVCESLAALHVRHDAVDLGDVEHLWAEVRERHEQVARHTDGQACRGRGV